MDILHAEVCCDEPGAPCPNPPGAPTSAVSTDSVEPPTYFHRPHRTVSNVRDM